MSRAEVACMFYSMAQYTNKLSSGATLKKNYLNFAEQKFFWTAVIFDASREYKVF